jgi:hypothetical protein
VEHTSKDSPLFLAGVDMVQRSGASSFEIRYSDDNEPTVWMAVASFSDNRWDAAAGHTPTHAVLRLLDQLIDGGMCTHCNRPTGITEDWRGDMPMAEVFCWYRYDPETEKFRRGCE